jgi:hypothetical protein
MALEQTPSQLASDTPFVWVFWIFVVIMAVSLIAIIITFIVVNTRVNAKIASNQDAISAVVVQDEANLINMGIELDSELNAKIGKVSTTTIAETTKTNKNVATLQNNVNTLTTAVNKNTQDTSTASTLANTTTSNQQKQNTLMSANISNVQQETSSMLKGTRSFDSLSIGPATITRDSKGGLLIDAGKIFTVTSSNMNVNVPNINIGKAYVLSEDSSGNLDLAGPGQLVLNNGIGIGTQRGWGIDQSYGGPLRVYAPASNMSSYVSLGFQQGKNNFKDTLMVKSKAAVGQPNGTGNDQVTVTGDLIVTGSMTAPYLAAMQAQLSTLSNQMMTANSMAQLAYNLAQQNTSNINNINNINNNNNNNNNNNTQYPVRVRQEY